MKTEWKKIEWGDCDNCGQCPIEVNSVIPSPSQDVCDGEEIRCPDCKATGGTAAEDGEAWLCWNEDGEEQK